jgi:hypothetical protein
MWMIALYEPFNSVLGVSVKSNPWTGPEGSRRLRLSDFKTVGR